MNPITVLYFGDLMNTVGIGREQFRLPPNIQDIAGVMRLLSMRGGDWKQAFGTPRGTLQVRINKKEAGMESPVNGGDEIAFIESLSL